MMVDDDTSQNASQSESADKCDGSLKSSSSVQNQQLSDDIITRGKVVN